MTPNIQLLARESVSFLNAFSQGAETSTCMRSLFIGLYPLRHRALGYDQGLSARAWPLARILGSKGYATCAIMSNAGRRPSLGLGFDCFEDISETGVLRDVTLHFNHTMASRIIDACSRKTAPRADEICEKTADFMRLKRDRPFFLYVHFMEPHATLIPPERYAARYPPAAYDASMIPGFNNDITGNLDPPAISKVQQARAWYDANASYVDEHIRHIVDDLRSRDL